VIPRPGARASDNSVTIRPYTPVYYKDDCIEDIAKLADEAIENETQDCIEVEVPGD
jgi:hypothetical protein